MIPRWVDSYAGIPFTEYGSSKAGCNCWGLCRLVFGRTGLWLDPRDEISSVDLVRSVKEIRREIRDAGTWRAVEEPRLFDFVLMRSLQVIDSRPRRLTNHIGILVSDSHVLHIERGINSICVPLAHFSIKPRIASFHRHVSQEG